MVQVANNVKIHLKIIFSGLGDAPCTFLGSSETDFIKIAGVTIPFMVKCGKIYFDVFPAFTLMGQLQVALKSEWREIDSMLVGQGNVPTLIPCITEIPVDGCEVFSFGDSRFKPNGSYSP